MIHLPPLIPARAGEGYFENDSMIRVVNQELVTAFSGGRALLMQGAHPVMYEGFYQASGSHGDIHGRLARTARIMNIIYYGSREDADRHTEAVRRMHQRVKGELAEPAGRFPAGTPYAADDPQYLLWTLASLWQSAELFYELYVRPLNPAEKYSLWRDYRVVGELFGLEAQQMPQHNWEAEEYMQEMIEGDQLYVTERSRETGRQVVMNPPAPVLMKPIVPLVNFAIVGSLPEKIRQGYGFHWAPGLNEMRNLGALYTRLQLSLMPAWVKNSPAAGGKLIAMSD